MALAPELPTVPEAALPGFESNQWWGLYGPLGLPAAVVSSGASVASLSGAILM